MSIRPVHGVMRPVIGRGGGVGEFCTTPIGCGLPSCLTASHTLRVRTDLHQVWLTIAGWCG